MKCPECNKEIVRVDSAEADGEYYHVEDTEWLVTPTREDPGILVPKKNTVPAVCVHHSEE